MTDTIPTHWINRRVVAAILHLECPDHIGDLAKKGYLAQKFDGYRCFYDPAEVRRLHETGWPQRKYYKYLDGWDYDERRRQIHNHNVKRYRDRRDPCPFTGKRVTVAEAAEALFYTQQAIRKFIRQGKLSAVKWRKKWWIDPLTLSPDCATIVDGGAEDGSPVLVGV